jgi:RNA methyltransferase, TrmH family
MEITSAKNPFLQSIRKAVATGRSTEDGLIIAEGPHLVDEALRGNWSIEKIFATEAARHRYSDMFHRAGCEVVQVSVRAFASIAATETTQEVLAVLRPRDWAWHDLISKSPFIVALDGIQDPGNAGAIVRSAEAFGATGVAFLKGCTRVANSKLLRATAGSIFRIPFVEGMTPAELIASARSGRLNLYGLSSSASRNLPEIDFREPCVLVVGSEAAGVSAEISSAAESIRIPTAKVESLNAAIACSIALFAARQQRGTP